MTEQTLQDVSMEGIKMKGHGTKSRKKATKNWAVSEG